MYICIETNPITMRRGLFLVIMLCISWAAMAQHRGEEYDNRQYSDIAEQEPILSDTLLFYRILHRPTDLYGEITAFNFSFIEFARRGIPHYAHPTLIDNITVRSANNAILRNLGLTNIVQPTAEQGYTAGSTHYLTTEGVPLSSARTSLFFTGKGYLGGIRATAHHLLRRGWSISAHIAARGGNSLYVDGESLNSIEAGIRLSHDLRSGDKLSIILATTLARRGIRSGTTREAFTLIGDNLYNPTWGYQAGERRNARERGECVPMMVASYHRQLSERTELLASIGGEWGKTTNTSLGWYGAATPRPDNYRLLPSYYTDLTVARAVEEVWRRADSRYTQIDWAELYTINAMAGGEARYALERRTSRIAHGEISASFRTAIDNDISLRYGVRAAINASRNYKVVGDLLGADHLTDIDYYLVDDDTYSLNLQNDLRHPNRRATKGDRFGYDYTLVERELSLYASATYQTERWSIEAYASLGSHATHRNGHFEKEIYPAEHSYGKSRTIRLSPYTLSTSAGYTFSPQHHISLTASLSRQAPYASSLWLNPQYNNRTIDNPSLEQHFTIDASYKYRSAKADITASAFLHSTTSATNTLRAYDDLSATFCDIVTSDISTLSYGVEFASEIRLSSHWRTTLSLGAGNYIYTNNPTITLFADTDNTLISQSRSEMQSCHIGGVPHISGSAEITYLDYSGWACSVGVNVAALRYVEPAFTRRSERVARQSATSEEIFREFISQEQLGDAATLDASLSRWFNIGQSRLSLTLSVKNLLGKRDIVYGGYESARIRHYRSGAQHIYRPQDNIVTYAYPRTIYFTTSWRF